MGGCGARIDARTKCQGRRGAADEGGSEQAGHEGISEHSIQIMVQGVQSEQQATGARPGARVKW